MRLPPEQVRRLYLLREHHQRGPIRHQIVRAIERYLSDCEAELAVAGDAVASTHPAPVTESRASTLPAGTNRSQPMTTRRT